jgi:hypothetical protein
MAPKAKPAGKLGLGAAAVAKPAGKQVQFPSGASLLQFKDELSRREEGGSMPDLQGQGRIPSKSVAKTPSSALSAAGAAIIDEGAPFASSSAPDLFGFGDAASKAPRKKLTYADLSDQEQEHFRKRRERYIDSVTTPNTVTEVMSWLRNLYEKYPKAYDDVAFQNEEDTDEGDNPFSAVGRHKSQEETVEDLVGDEEIVPRSVSVEVSQVLVSKDERLDDGDVLQYLRSFGPRQRKAFQRLVTRLVRELHDEVHAETTAAVTEHWKRTRNLQVISDKTNELRLQNKTRVTFKTALNKRMPQILREAVRQAKKVHEVEEGEEQAEIATRVHQMITKPNSGVDTNQVVDKIEFFAGHQQSWTTAPKIYKPLVYFSSVF